jgi:hypothetical protein
MDDVFSRLERFSNSSLFLIFFIAIHREYVVKKMRGKRTSAPICESEKI